MDMRKTVRRCLEKLYDARYRKKVKHYLLRYDAWVSLMEKNSVSCGSASETADFVLLPEAGGSWTKEAGEMFARFFAAHPQTMIAYGDEDVKQPDGSSGMPWLKPDWSPDTWLSRDYLGSAVAVRKDLYRKLTEEELSAPELCHKRLVELAGGFEKGCNTIGHVTGICFHRDEVWQMPPEKEAENKCAWDEMVTVIIPSKDNVTVLSQCLLTLQRTVCRIPYEIVIVDNGSCEHTRVAVEKEIEKINQNLTKESCLKNVRYLYEPMEFNFSRMCNIGAKQAKGNLFLFLNDDIEAVEPGWMEKMAAKAREPWAGAVGVKLWYPDSDRIQHAGITNISIGPVHKLQFLKDNKCYYDGRNRGTWNVLAVTGACMMTRKSVFEEVGGFAEEMRVAFNDVDLCFSLYEKGYYNIVLNTIHLLHHESLSRGADESEEKLKRLARERTVLYGRHPGLEGSDPYYHSWLNGNGLDTRIVPSLETGRILEDRRSYAEGVIPENARKDDCLLVRIEASGEHHLQGYAVVLGSDNACYAKKLLFQSKMHPETVYEMEYTEQYRSDLSENMPDQNNIALSGFCITFAKPLPKGEYRIGALARDRISGTMLFNFSNRTIYV